MKILLLLGSPRKGGNTDCLAEAVASGAEENGAQVESIRLNGLNLKPCQGCGACDKNGICIIDDDMRSLYPKCDEVDRVILASPVYFYGLCAQAKIFGDRMQAQWARRYLMKERFRRDEGRKGYLIMAAATKGTQLFDASILTTRYIFDAMEMKYGGELTVRGVDARKAVLKDEQAMEDAKQFGRDIANGLK